MKFFISRGFLAGLLLVLTLVGCDGKKDTPTGSIGSSIPNKDLSSMTPCQQYLYILEACMVAGSQSIDQQKLQSARDNLLIKISQSDEQHEEACKKSLLSIDEHKKSLGCSVP